jgi:hypothetical protein
MNRILRSTIVSAVAAAGLVLGLGTQAVAAQNAVAFVGTASIACFGCGASTGTATLNLTGTLNGPITATYTVNEPQATCPAAGTAQGTYSGVANGTFTWTRIGGVALITTQGDLAGSGVAAFAVTNPSATPCGKPLTAMVTGAVVQAG